MVYLDDDFETPHENGEDVEDGLSAQDLVDFSPLYRCLHIFTVLGDKHTFENYYRKQRKEQSSLVLQPVSNMVCAVPTLQTQLYSIKDEGIIHRNNLNHSTSF